MNIRMPVVAGSFYPASASALERQIQGLVKPDAAKKNAIGVVSPHAGYIYSGTVAGSVLSAIEPKPTYIIMGPNHTGRGAIFSVDPSDQWKTPFGNVPIDKELTRAILDNAKDAELDASAHEGEHSIEVQLPFLQRLQKEFSFVPIIVAYAKPLLYKKLAQGIAEAIRSTGRAENVTIISSSDMTHYEPHEVARKKDTEAINAILALDEEMLLEKIADLDISMCGFAPTYVMLVAAKLLGARKAELVLYQTSADASGDFSSVVGYAGIMVT